MNNKDRYIREGQSIILVALLIVVFIGMLAVVLDGGYAYLQRRAAQTAADAGALAGANVLCDTLDTTLAINSALEYAIQRNEAVQATASVDSGIVTVDTQIPFQTFFGTVFNRPQLVAAAVAEAGCFAPGKGVGILPIAYGCVDGVLTETDDYDEGHPSHKFCGELNFVTDDDWGFDDLYIIMNSSNVSNDITCLSEDPINGIDCDIDNDGVDELLTGGNRSWLDLTGSGSDAGNGSNELREWILNGFGHPVSIHTWFAGQPGVSNNVFMSIEEIVLSQEIYIPVYDAISSGVPDVTGGSGYHVGVDKIVLSNGNSTFYYHVISFAKFVPVCVHATGGDKDCDLYNAFLAAGTLGPDDKTVEGYFEIEHVTGFDGKPMDGVYAGIYTVYLIR